MLTDEGDLVLDIFGGSNTTGFAAEALNRRWLTFELNQDYLTSSLVRFLEGWSIEEIREILGNLRDGQVNCTLGRVHCSLDSAKPMKARGELEDETSLFSSVLSE